MHHPSSRRSRKRSCAISKLSVPTALPSRFGDAVCVGSMKLKVRPIASAPSELIWTDGGFPYLGLAGDKIGRANTTTQGPQPVWVTGSGLADGEFLAQMSTLHSPASRACMAIAICSRLFALSIMGALG